MTVNSMARIRDAAVNAIDARETCTAIQGLLEYTLRVVYGCDSESEHTLLDCPIPAHKQGQAQLQIRGETWTCQCTDGFSDVIDLIRLVDACSEEKAIARIVAISDAYGLSGYTSPGQEIEGSIDEVSLIRWQNRATAEVDELGLDAISELLDSEDLLSVIDPRWLLDNFHLGIDDNRRVVVPHIDKGGQTVGYRTMGYPQQPPSGSLSNGMYRRHEGVDGDSVVLCADELDTWLLSYMLRGTGQAVLGLPTGTHGPRPEWLESFEGKEITIVFPAHELGRSAARSWARSLIDRCPSIAVVKLDEGTTARTTTALRTRLRHAVPVTHPSPKLNPNRFDHRYEQVLAKGDPKPVSDFLLIPVHTVAHEQDARLLAYACYFSDDPGKSEVIITTEDTVSDTALRKWASRQSGGRTWKGMANAASSLNELLRAEAPFLPTIRATSRSGLHDGVFVMPDETIAPRNYQQPWILVTSGSRIETAWRKSLDTAPSRGGGEKEMARLAELLESMNAPETISPIIAWLAAAPLRVLSDQFPILAILGQSGSGKTATMELLLNAWWGVGSVNNIGSGTQFTDYSALGSSNTIPLALDEYRTGDTKRQRDRIMEVDEVIRSSYRRSGTLRRGEAGRGGVTVRETHLHRPLVILGETVFEDLAVRERSVMVTPMRHEQTPNAFLEASTAVLGKEGSIGRSFLSWLTSMRPELLAGGQPIVQPRPSRPAHNKAVLRAGWDLYRQWNIEYLDRIPAVELDLTRTQSQWDRADDGNPIWIEGIEHALDTQATTAGSSHRIVFRHTGREPNTICVNIAQLVRFMKFRSYDLPGGTRTLEAALREAFPTGEANVRRTCGCLDCPRSRVFDTGVVDLR